MSKFSVTVSASFETLELPGFLYEPILDERGVLLRCWAPANKRTRSRFPEPPDFAMGFVKTNLNIGHNTILNEYPDPRYAANRQPVAGIPIGPSGFRIAARYLLEADRGLSINLMLGPTDIKQDVRRFSNYETARQQLAVACAQAILGPSADTYDGIVSVQVRSNFENLFLRNTKPWAATGVEQLSQCMQSQQS
ncbi:MAG TPA: hypothetical protein VFB59_03450 [Candidatus Saccharimonadales bacterium]|nr:hypothetical protein [Candidatus Saccharimonadales bacterium]